MIQSRPVRGLCRGALVGVLVGVLAGCSGGPAASPPASVTPTPPTVTPAVTVPSATPIPSTAPTTTTAPTPERTLEPPPGAELVVGGARQVGRVGSWVWAGGSDSAPWLPASALEAMEVTAGASASVELVEPIDVDAWTARAAPADDPSGASARPLDEGAGLPAFDLPAAGDWVVAVHVQFAGGLGDATWYWHVIGS